MESHPDVLEPEIIAPPPGAEQRKAAMLCHLLGFIGFLLPLAGNILGPLTVWLLKRHSMPFVNTVGREAVNFQISWSLYLAASWALTSVCIGWIPLVALVLLEVFLMVTAALQASAGRSFRYPLTFRLIP